MKPVLAFLAALTALASAGAAPHNPLLPRPQEVHYGSGSLALKGLSIRFGAPPNVEDRFAAEELAVRLSALTQTAVPIRTTGARGRSIVLHRTGDGPPLPHNNETTGPDARESYTLNITSKGAEICGPSSAGLFYGVQTLLQMAEGCGAGAALPVAEVRDWPMLAYRGFMMDLSHGQLLRVAEIERQLDLLARFKANQYFFYSEAAIELEGYELVNPEGRYTRDEVRHIIGYARQRHIDVVPCLELYGHLHDLFRLEKFADAALPRYGSELDPANPRVLAMLDDLIAQTAQLFPSPWYHVGFDEPWALGKFGASTGTDPYRKYIEVLRHVSGEAQHHHKRLLFWADMLSGAQIFSKHPELIHELPAESIAVPWVYSALTNYDPYITPLAQLNVPTVVAPGIYNWNEAFPDYHRTFSNINGLIADGKKHKALGVLNTGWTDCAQTIYRQSLPGLAFGAAAGWQAEAVDPHTFFGDYCRQMYPTTIAGEIAAALEELSRAEEIYINVLGGSTMRVFWTDPLEPSRLAHLERFQAQLRQARLLAESAQERLQRASRLAPDPTLPSLLLAARMFDYLGMKNLYVVEWAGYFRQLKEKPDAEMAGLLLNTQMAAQDHGMITDLMDSVTGLREEYRRAWLEESTSYRLGTALARWDAETEFWRALQSRVQHVLNGWKQGDPFPSVDAIRPPK
jgi:hexosaminidase